MKNFSIGVCIITRNRVNDLVSCVSATYPQLLNRDRLLIINNHSTDGTKAYLNTLEKKSIGVINLTTNSMFHARKIAFQEVLKDSLDLLVYIDDDCVPSRNWLVRIREGHSASAHPVIQGHSVSLPTDHTLSQLSQRLGASWVYNNTDAMGLVIIDTKNVSLRAERGLFETIFSNNGIDLLRSSGCEDVIIGARLRRAGIRVGYSRRILVMHKERTSVMGFVRQRVRMMRNKKYYVEFLSERDGYPKVRSNNFLQEVGIFTGLLWEHARRLDVWSILTLVWTCIIITVIKACIWLNSKCVKVK